MKILIYTDVHWSQYSSIVREMGDKYSVRLNHLIQSVNWAEELAMTEQCDMVWNGGDFFNSIHMNNIEMSALSEIKWASLPHVVLVGNHELSSKNRELSSVHLLKLLGFEVITEPTMVDCGEHTICYLPYMFEYTSIEELFPTNKKRIIFSHNDVEGVKVGGYVFDHGFSLDDIKNNCEIFLNGHIHSKSTFGNMINLGSLCGQNFGENNIPHNAYVFDTDTLELKDFENPFALHFYKLNCTKRVKLPNLKNNRVLSVLYSDDTMEEVQRVLNGLQSVVARKLTYIPKVIDDDTQSEEDQIEHIDHLDALRTYILDELGTTAVVQEELDIIAGK